MNKEQKYILRKSLIYVMLCVYIFGLIKPVMPVVKDVMAHTFFKNSHMASVHYEHGKYHMHLELQEEAKNNASKHVPVLSNNESLFAHIKSDDMVFAMYLQKISEINSPYLDAPIDVFILTPLLPPEC